MVKVSFNSYTLVQGTTTLIISKPLGTNLNACITNLNRLPSDSYLIVSGNKAMMPTLRYKLNSLGKSSDINIFTTNTNANVH
jgi:hypothetical protein